MGKDRKVMSWDEIKSKYPNEWVELINYEWNDVEPYPRGGVVRVHAKNRAEFDKLINQDPPHESALIFVGEREPKKGEILSANLHSVAS